MPKLKKKEIEVLTRAIKCSQVIGVSNNKLHWSPAKFICVRKGRIIAESMIGGDRRVESWTYGAVNMFVVSASGEVIRLK